MSKFVIEKGVEIPKKKAGPGSESMYPFAQMEPGDSFFIPASGITQKNLQRRMATAAKRTGSARIPGSKWTTRKVEGGIRVWRVA